MTYVLVIIVVCLNLFSSIIFTQLTSFDLRVGLELQLVQLLPMIMFFEQAYSFEQQFPYLACKQVLVYDPCKVE